MPPARRRTGALPDRAALSASVGYRVESRDGEIGRVEEIRYGPDGAPEVLLLATDTFSRTLLELPVARVRRVDPKRRRIFVRRAAIPPRARLFPAGFFIAAAGAFLLPFVTVEVERRAKATGVQLAANDPDYSGHYVHGTYAGMVEYLIRRGHYPALAGLLLAALGLLVLALPGRLALRAAAAVGVLGLFDVFAVWQVTTPPSENFATSNHKAGLWVAALLFAASAAAAGWSLYRVHAGAD